MIPDQLVVTSIYTANRSTLGVMLSIIMNRDAS